MTAVALIMFDLGILMMVSALQGVSISTTAAAIVAGQPIDFTPMPTQGGQQAGATQQGGTAIVGNQVVKTGINKL